jgi:hypothetical protein
MRQLIPLIEAGMSDGVNHSPLLASTNHARNLPACPPSVMTLLQIPTPRGDARNDAISHQP